MPNGKKKKGHKMATHKRKKRLRKNRHKSKYCGGKQKMKGALSECSLLLYEARLLFIVSTLNPLV